MEEVSLLWQDLREPLQPKVASSDLEDKLPLPLPHA